MNEASKNQLEYWTKGVSVHNEVDDECCPDFSCCNKNQIMAYFSNLTEKEYATLSYQDARCPFCFSDNTEADYQYLDLPYAYQVNLCNDCHKKFMDGYICEYESRDDD